MAESRPRALFAISSLGLGHATRSLPIIHGFLEQGWRIHIISSGNAYLFLLSELDWHPQVSFRETGDYPALERGNGLRMYWYLCIDLVRTWRLIRQEHRELEKEGSVYDFIFSDGRYGFYSANCPSFILTHQVAFIPPPLLKRAFRLTQRINLLALKKFDTIFIPDFPDCDHNLSGKLSHLKLLSRYAHKYIGLLSSYHKLDVHRDIDYLFVISGYLIEHKEPLLHKLMDQAKNLEGKKVFILGQKDSLPADFPCRNDVEILPMASGDERQRLFNRSKTIIARSGFTTVMDLVEHGKQGVLIPTPNQTEQEYLADYLNRKKYFLTFSQDGEETLQSAIKNVGNTEPFRPPWRTESSVKIVYSAIETAVYKRFISIIVPAHNEEKEIAATLKCLLSLCYPADRYEVIVVENGSTDETLAIAGRIIEESSGRQIRLLQSAKGVSTAKNLGLANISASSEWVVFCDADTHLGPLFLRQLNTFLGRTKKSISVGTCSIKPRPVSTGYARAWFRMYDHIHRITKTSYSLQISSTNSARNVRFHQGIELAEDLLFIKGCLRLGTFFFMETDQVSTSTRRFMAFGYLGLSLRWVLGALLPLRYLHNRRYDAVR
jgi:hypothetical protein